MAENGAQNCTFITILEKSHLNSKSVEYIFEPQSQRAPLKMVTTNDKKIVLITGSNRGIGLAFATHYASQGWNVIAAVRDLATAEDVSGCLLL